MYVSRTYSAMVPYLKGLHLTLDSWRPDRDEDGWRTTNTVEKRFTWNPKTKRPQFVRMVPRFKGDVKMLINLTHHKDPPKVPTRPTAHAATYLVGDVSGAG